MFGCNCGLAWAEPRLSHRWARHPGSRRSVPAQSVSSRIQSRAIPVTVDRAEAAYECYARECRQLAEQSGIFGPRRCTADVDCAVHSVSVKHGYLGSSGRRAGGHNHARTHPHPRDALANARIDIDRHTAADARAPFRTLNSLCVYIYLCIYLYLSI